MFTITKENCVRYDKVLGNRRFPKNLKVGQGCPIIAKLEFCKKISQRFVEQNVSLLPSRTGCPIIARLEFRMKF